MSDIKAVHAVNSSGASDVYTWRRKNIDEVPDDSDAQRLYKTLLHLQVNLQVEGKDGEEELLCDLLDEYVKMVPLVDPNDAGFGGSKDWKPIRPRPTPAVEEPVEVEQEAQGIAPPPQSEVFVTPAVDPNDGENDAT